MNSGFARPDAILSQGQQSPTRCGYGSTPTGSSRSIFHLHLNPIDATRHRAPSIVLTRPDTCMIARRQDFIQQGVHAPPTHIINTDIDFAALGSVEADLGPPQRWIGIAEMEKTFAIGK